MTSRPLMPRATAVWLIDNTSLSFEQIAHFCQFHILDVHMLADDSSNVVGINPVLNNQLSKQDIKRCENDHTLRLTLNNILLPENKVVVRKYVPIINRQDKLNVILWLTENKSSLSDTAIARLVGTTKKTISSIKNKIHPQYHSLNPKDPVSSGFCSQESLDLEVEKSLKKKKAIRKE